MNPIQQCACAAALAAAFAGAVHAQAPAGVAPPARLMAAELADGEVRRIDKVNRKITLKHGEIKNLGMAPMAMVFDVKDRALIGKLKVGDKVKFRAVYEAGKYIVTEIRPAQ